MGIKFTRRFSFYFAVALILAGHFSSSANGMEIFSNKQGDYVLATGTIVPSDAERLRARLAGGTYAGKWLALDSLGGSVLTGLDLGRLVRRWNMKTVVLPGAKCFSACLLIFLGGEERVVSDGGRLGSHQFRWTNDGEGSVARRAAEAQELSGKVLQHFLSLGASAEALVAVMGVPSDEMHIFSPYELERYKLVGRFDVSENPPTVIRDGFRREGCPFPDDFIGSDPLRLYTACY